MILGLFTTPAHAAVCLSNLLEQEVDPSCLSVVAIHPQTDQAMAVVSGRFQAHPVAQVMAQLLPYGLTPSQATQLSNLIEQGGVGVIIETSPAQVSGITETLQDHQATEVIILANPISQP